MNKAEANRINGRKGGRPKGKRSQAVLDREKTLEAYRQRVMKIAGKMLDKQLVLANGQQFLYKIVKEKIIGPKGGISYKSKSPTLVENESEIRDYLDNEVARSNGDIHDDQDPGATFYFITVKEPDGKAIDSMMDRTFGRAVQSTKLVGDDGKVVPITSINIVPLDLPK